MKSLQGPEGRTPELLSLCQAPAMIIFFQSRSLVGVMGRRERALAYSGTLHSPSASGLHQTIKLSLCSSLPSQEPGSPWNPSRRPRSTGSWHRGPLSLAGMGFQGPRVGLSSSRVPLPPHFQTRSSMFSSLLMPFTG